MEITYKQIINPFTSQVDENGIIKLPEFMLIPKSEDSPEWKKYEEWLEAGGVPLPPV
jgi:hypothetical protein